jgi:hypothetical protein
VLDALHYLSGGAVGFARGLNDTPKMVALLMAGEAAVKLNRLLAGRFTSRRGAYAQPPAEQIEELRRYYGPIFPGVQAP